MEEGCGQGGRPDEVKAQAPEDRQVLWDEYKHRHNLVWRFVAQVTLAAVFLSIVPYIAPRLAIEALGRWLFVVPTLALLLVFFSLRVMSNELELLRRITEAHRREQRTRLQIPHVPLSNRHFRPWIWISRDNNAFDNLMCIYLWFLLLVGALILLVGLFYYPASH